MTADHDAFLKRILSAPDDPVPVLIYADYVQESGDEEGAAALRRGRMLLDDADRMAAVCLIGCNFAPATWDKRFVRNVCTAIDEGAVDELTPKQRYHLWRLAHRYRRQILRGDQTTLDPNGRRYVVQVAAWLTETES